MSDDFQVSEYCTAFMCVIICCMIIPAHMFANGRLIANVPGHVPGSIGVSTRCRVAVSCYLSTYDHIGGDPAQTTSGHGTLLRLLSTTGGATATIHTALDIV